MRLEDAIWISIDVDDCLLTRTHVGQAGLAEVRLDPDASARHQREHRGSRIDEVADLQVVDPGHDAVVGRHHRRVGQIEPGPVELGLGCADGRMAIDLDVRIAVQRGHGVGDLVFNRYDLLTSDLEIFVGSVKNLSRRPTISYERSPSRILTLIEVRGVACRLPLGQLLAIGGFELVDLEARAGKSRLGLIDGNLVRLRIDPEQELAPLNPLIVNDGDFDHLAGNPGVDQFLGCADESVVRRDIRLLGEMVHSADGNQYDRKCHQQQATQSLLRWHLRHRGGAAGYGTVKRSAELGVDLDELFRAAFVHRDAGSHQGADWCEIGLHGEPHGCSVLYRAAAT